MREIEIIDHLTDDELQLHWRREKDGRRRERWRLLCLVQGEGLEAAEAARQLGYRKSWASKWIKVYNLCGPSGLGPLPSRPRRIILTPAVLANVGEAVSEPVPEDLGGGLWNGVKVQRWLATRRSLKVSRQTGWKALKKGASG
jgi:transposase